MKVIGLNNKEYILNLSKYLKNKDRSNKSNLHLKARELIKECFESYNVYEEVKLPGSTNPKNRSTLFIDFLIPNLNLGIEIHGKQHFEYIPYFHKDKLGFLKHKHRDVLKAQWCDKNNIKLLILRYDEIDLWRIQLECC